MQLVAYGAQDVYITGEPTITFWKIVYRRHTNFAMESMQQTFNGTPAFGNQVTCRISRNGDLMHRCYVQVTLPSLDDGGKWCNRVGFKLLKQVELRVGGQMIDRHYSTWMQIWSELTHTTDKKALLDKLVGPTGTDGAVGANNVADGTAVIVNIPLMFAFNRHPGLALPLIALQYHEVELWVTFEQITNLQTGLDAAALPTGNMQAVLWVDYVFLDTEERKEFAQKPHEYLIECTQQQAQSVNGNSNNSVRLTFNHPTKFIAWVIRPTVQTAAGDEAFNDQFTNFTNNAGAPGGDAVNGAVLKSANLKLNGQDRFQTRDNTFFNYIQPYQGFSGKPDLGVNVYSFSLKPEEHQPSGTCNLSRIDNVSLELQLGDIFDLDGESTTINTGNLEVYAFNYNVFRVASGMGGLAYSN